MTKKELAKYIDHTCLKDITRKDVNKMIEEAKKYGFHSLCIHHSWVHYAQQKLEGTSIQVGTVPNWVVGGGIYKKVPSTEFLMKTADYIDYIWGIYLFAILKDWDKTKKELEIVRKYTKGELKIIIEAFFLHEKADFNKPFKLACKMVKDCGADFIKSDSGLLKREDFNTLVEDIKLMRKYSKGLKIKAAGGIKNLDQVKQLIKLGVTRIGTSSGVKIIEKFKE